ncbi:MAG: NADPH-dependent FMN reductase [Bacteroidota bacterium]
MNDRKKIIAICGSTRMASTNLNYLKAISMLLDETVTMEIFTELASLPPFNPDHDTEQPPAPVVFFRNKLKEADGILICTPEYAMGVPGTLKNAIDWTVSSMEFSSKPVALITASSMGEKGHRSLLETLHIIEARMTQQTQLLISFAKTKINERSIITDSETLKQVNHLLDDFCKML